MSFADIRSRSFSLIAFLSMVFLGAMFAGAQNFRGGIN